jgi:hypothetical protein
LTKENKNLKARIEAFEMLLMSSNEKLPQPSQY